MNYLKKVISPPVFEDEVKTQQAYLLNIILWTLIFVPIPFVIYTFSLTPENNSRVMTQVIFGETVNIILLIMLHRGYVRLASMIQVSAFWLFFTATAATGPGVQGEAYLLGYGLVIVIAGILLGVTGALIFAFLSIAAGGLMVYAQMEGLISAGFDSSPLTTWIISLLLFPVGAILQYLGARTTRLALARAQASEERYRLISKVSSDYTFSTELNPEGKMRLNWVAGAFERMTGYTFEEYVKAGGWQGHLYPEDVERDEQAFKQLAKNQSVINEVRTYKKDREITWVRVYAHPVWDENQNRLVGIVGGVQDITSQKQAEEALRRSESIYQKAIEVAGAVPYHQTFDAEGRIIYDFMGEGIRQITGYASEEFNDDLWGSLVQERHLLGELEPYSLNEAIEQVRTGKIPIWKCEHCIKARDGKIHWVFEAAVDLRDERGIAYGSIGLYQDITERKQAEDALRASEAIYRQAVEVAGAVPYHQSYQEDGRAIYDFIGEGIHEITGYTPEKFTELLWDSLVIDRLLLDDLAGYSFDEAIQRVRRGDNPTWKCEHCIQALDGKIHWVLEAAVELRDEKGISHGSVGMFQDITERKLAEEFEKRRRTMLEKVIQLGKRVTEASDFHTTLKKIWHGVREALGFDRVGLFLYDPQKNVMQGTYGTDRSGEMIEAWDVYFGLDPQAHFYNVLRRPDGLYFSRDYEKEFGLPPEHVMAGVKYYASVAVWAGDKPVAIISVDQLLTNRSITEEQLEALRLFAGYAGLAIENARLNSALEEDLKRRQTLIEELETKNAELERFTYTVSHDLKSPLVTITGFLGYLENDALTGNQKKIKAGIERITNAAQKMQTLLSDLLELSRIGRLMNTPEIIPFEEIVRESLDHIRGRLELNRIKVEVQDSLPAVYGDKIRLVEVMQNLLDNAAKFSSHRPDALISIGSKGIDKMGHPILFVRDNGIGIAPQYHEKIFGLFDKLDPTAEGTGVGLTLVKRIIEVHGGKIWLESQPGSGSTFYFTLPGKPDKE